MPSKFRAYKIQAEPTNSPKLAKSSTMHLSSSSYGATTDHLSVVALIMRAGVISCAAAFRRRVLRIPRGRLAASVAVHFGAQESLRSVYSVHLCVYRAWAVSTEYQSVWGFEIASNARRSISRIAGLKRSTTEPCLRASRHRAFMEVLLKLHRTFAPGS